MWSSSLRELVASPEFDGVLARVRGLRYQVSLFLPVQIQPFQSAPVRVAALGSGFGSVFDSGLCSVCVARALLSSQDRYVRQQSVSPLESNFIISCGSEAVSFAGRVALSFWRSDETSPTCSFLLLSLLYSPMEGRRHISSVLALGFMSIFMPLGLGRNSMTVGIARCLGLFAALLIL